MNCFCQIVSVEPNTGGFVLNIFSLLSGVTVPESTVSTVQVQVLGGDTPNDIRQKISNAVVTDWAANGFVVPPSNVILPSFQKGI